MRKMRNGVFVRNMTDEEYDLYVSACELLSKTPRNRDGSEGVPEATNVVPLYKGDRVGVPEAGASAEKGDHRVRYRMKYAGRLGKRWSEIIQDVQNGKYTWDEFVSSLTPEELARGQLRDKDGGFMGRPPSFVPRQFHDACIRELLGRGRVLYKESYIKAITAMAEIATSKTAKESDRIKAATFVVERIEGKVPDRLEVSASDPWQQVISGIIAEVEDDQIANAQQYLNRMNGSPSSEG